MSIFSNSLTGSLLGSSSYAVEASQSLSSSYAATASFAFSLVNPVVGGAIISASNPGIQPSGTLWYNSTDNNLYVQTGSASGSQYVVAVAGAGATFRGSYNGTTWTVNHNLGTTSPLIQVYSGSAVMIPASIISTNANTSTITFASGFSGSVVASTGVGGTTTASLALNATNAVTASYVGTPTICLQGDLNQFSNVNTTLYSAARIISASVLTNKFSIGTFTVSNAGITPSESGFYEISYTGYGTDAGVNPTVGYLMIGVNNTELIRTEISHGPGYRASYALSSIHQVIAGQRIDIRFSTSGGEAITLNDTTIIIRKVG